MTTDTRSTRRTRRRAALGLVGVLALTAGLAAGCGDDDDDDDAGSTETSAADAGTETSAADAATTTAAAGSETSAAEGGGEAAGGAASVAIADFAFDPAEASVAAGDTVTWTNNDPAAHTVTFEDGSADSGDLAQGATFEHTFDAAGEYAYRCDIHPSMTGTIVVA
jgi:plastocyanin